MHGSQISGDPDGLYGQPRSAQLGNGVGQLDGSGHGEVAAVTWPSVGSAVGSAVCSPAVHEIESANRNSKVRIESS